MIVKFIDLFARMGGFRLGFENACKKLNIYPKCVFTSEIKPHALEVYNKNFGEKNVKTDITKISSEDIPGFDVLLGGFPCQAFSCAGKRRGFEDTRGTLFFEIARILKDKRPSAFILENVEALTFHDGGNTFKTILNVLHELNYQVSHKVLNGSDFGLAQSRKRIFIVGTKKESISLDFPKATDRKVKDILENIVGDPDEFSKAMFRHLSPNDLRGKEIRDYRLSTTKVLRGWELGLKGEVSDLAKDIMRFLIKEGYKHKRREKVPIDMSLVFTQFRNFPKTMQAVQELEDRRYAKRSVIHSTGEEFLTVCGGNYSYKFSRFLNNEGHSPTLVASDMSRIGVVGDNFIRTLTPVESLRLFGYPDDWDFNGLPISKIYDLTGNSLCVPIVEAISERVLNSIFKDFNKKDTSCA